MTHRTLVERAARAGSMLEQARQMREAGDIAGALDFEQTARVELIDIIATMDELEARASVQP